MWGDVVEADAGEAAQEAAKGLYSEFGDNVDWLPTHAAAWARDRNARRWDYTVPVPQEITDFDFDAGLSEQELLELLSGCQDTEPEMPRPDIKKMVSEYRSKK